ncbi:hypothetical protein JXI42_05505 [bacterium]|nr:hypothetical protein [bacterium]
MIWDKFPRDGIPWFATNPGEDIVLTTRVRIARNLAEHKFLTRCNKREKTGILTLVKENLVNSPLGELGSYHRMQDLSSDEKKFLVERHLISSDLSASREPSGVFLLEGDHALSIMINEEDHLRTGSIYPGYNLENSFNRLKSVDEILADYLSYAYSSRWGYLTACPTNCGTAMRASFLCHLPGIVTLNEFEKFREGLILRDLSVRGFYGEGTQVYGNIFQIYTNKSLGMTQNGLLDIAREGLEFITGFERQCRKKLREELFFQMENKVWRTVGIIKYAKALSSSDALKYLSTIWLGYSLKILMSNGKSYFPSDSFILVQPTHLQLMLEARLTSQERDVFRAQYIRRKLSSEEWYKVSMD